MAPKQTTRSPRVSKTARTSASTDRTLPPPSAKLSQALREFMSNEKSRHPIHRNEATLVAAEKRFGASIQPWWHAKDTVLPATMRSFGCHEADYDKLTSGQYYTCRSKGPACRDGCVQHKKECLPAFAYVHPSAVCASAQKAEGVTLITRTYGGRFATCHACWMDGKRPPCSCAQVPLSTSTQAGPSQQRGNTSSEPPPSSASQDQDQDELAAEYDMAPEQYDPDSIHVDNLPASEPVDESYLRKRPLEEGEDELDSDGEPIDPPSKKVRRPLDVRRLSGALQKLPSPRSSPQPSSAGTLSLPPSSPLKTPRLDKGKQRAEPVTSATAKPPPSRGPSWRTDSQAPHDSPLADRSFNNESLRPSVPPSSPAKAPIDYEARWRHMATEPGSSRTATPYQTPPAPPHGQGRTSATVAQVPARSALSPLALSSAPKTSAASLAPSAPIVSTSAVPTSTSAGPSKTSAIPRLTSAIPELSSAQTFAVPGSSAGTAKLSSGSGFPFPGSTTATTAKQLQTTSEMYEKLYSAIEEIQSVAGRQETFLKTILEDAWHTYAAYFKSTREAVEADFQNFRYFMKTCTEVAKDDRAFFANLDKISKENAEELIKYKRTVRMLEEQCSEALQAKERAESAAAEKFRALNAELVSKEKAREELANQLSDMTNLWHSAISERKVAEVREKEAWEKANNIVEEMKTQRDAAVAEATLNAELRDVALRRAEEAEASAEVQRDRPRVQRRYSFGATPSLGPIPRPFPALTLRSLPSHKSASPVSGNV